MWRERSIRWCWIIMVLNVAIALLNSGFSYGHWVKHEYWLMLTTVALVCLNTWVAWYQFKTIRRFRQELKEMMWRTLSTPSEQLR